MATRRILRLTNQEAIIKVDGAIGEVTVSLATDLKLANEDVASPSVNILAMQVTGLAGGIAKIERNSVTLYQMEAGATPLDLLALGGVSDNTLSTHDIKITTSGAETQVILKLRKNSGYTSYLQSATYGIYDNEGSATS